MTSLMQQGIDLLRKRPERQCYNDLKTREGMVCAEGVFAELLAICFPERFRWEERSTWLDFWDEELPHRNMTLTGEQWDMLHPRGSDIAEEAARAFGANTIAEVNDDMRISFPDIANAMQHALDVMENR